MSLRSIPAMALVLFLALVLFDATDLAAQRLAAVSSH